ncbi:MAG TPA: prepilin-type N-terminal cleavage/methylation domain-containing protein [Gemmatimonadaceae bacterium]
MKAPRAVTLVELLVVLVLMGLVAGVVGLTIHTAKPLQGTDPITSAIAVARDSAIRTGRSVIISLQLSDGQRDVTASPDGRVIADSSMGIDPLTGVRNAIL